MKFLFLASGSARSSLTHRILSFATALVAQGHEVTMIAPMLDKYTGYTPERITEIDGVRIRHPYQFQTRSGLINLIPYIVAASTMVLLEKTDVVYLYKPTPASIVGLFAKLIKRTPVILDMDDLGSEVMATENQPKMVVSLVAACEAMAARYADSIVVASTFLRRKYNGLRLHQTVTWIPNGVDSGSFRDARASGKVPQLIFLGALNRRSILEPILRSMPRVLSNHPDARLVIAGDGSEKQYLEGITRELDISQAVKFVGWTHFKELRKYSRPGDLGICWMPKERTTLACSNQKVFQYMALGLVPVVSNVGDLPAYVGNGQSGIVVSDNPDSLGKALSAALGRGDLKKLSRLAAKRSREVYDWSLLAEQVNAVAMETIARKHKDTKRAEVSV